MGRGDIHQLEDIILTRLLIWDACASSSMERIGIGVRCCIKPRLISGEVLTSKHCGVETHGSRKWDPPPPEEEFLIAGRGDIIFIYPFLLGSELSSDIVAILESTKRMESWMRTFLQINSPQNQEENPDPHEPKVLFFCVSGKQESEGQSYLWNLSELEEPP